MNEVSRSTTITLSALLAIAACDVPGGGEEGSCACDVTYACDPGCEACDPECRPAGEEAVKQPSAKKDTTCAFGGTYNYVMEGGQWALDCRAVRTKVEVLRRRSSGRLTIGYDAEADVVVIEGPFGPDWETTHAELAREETEEGVVYVSRYRTVRPSGSVEPWVWRQTVSVSASSIQTPACEFRISVNSVVGMDGLGGCWGDIPILLYR